MQKSQPDFKIDIKSPIFTPRPGWGGKLKNWLKKNGQSKVLPVTSIVVLVLGIYMYWDKFGAQKQDNDIVSATIEKTAEPRQGLTHLARAAISDYLMANNIELSSEQRIYAETYLVSIMGKKSVSVGETISFDKTKLADAVEKAKNIIT